MLLLVMLYLYTNRLPRISSTPKKTCFDRVIRAFVSQSTKLWNWILWPVNRCAIRIPQMDLCLYTIWYPFYTNSYEYYWVTFTRVYSILDWLTRVSSKCTSHRNPTLGCIWDTHYCSYSIVSFCLCVCKILNVLHDGHVIGWKQTEINFFVQYNRWKTDLVLFLRLPLTSLRAF